MRSLVTILLGAVLLFPLSALATEIPGGPVYGHWYSSGNPYNVNGNINVPVDSTLYIHEGVEVIFQGSYSFDVYGFLEAVGTEADSIHFRPSGYDWLGICFTNAPDSSHLSYCILERGATGGQGGGVITCVNSNPVLAHCRLSNCELYGYGGAMYLDSSNPTISNCTFSDNEAGLNGGAMYCTNSDPTLSYCTFSRNFAYGGGGAIFVTGNSNLTLSHCTIMQNEAWENGGGIYAGGNSSLFLSNCSIYSNRTWRAGGGIAFNGGYGFTCTVSECNIYYNHGGSEGGGGIWVRSGNAFISKCTTHYNSCLEDPGQGGGIYADCDTLVVDHCSFNGDYANDHSSPNIGNIMHIVGSTVITLSNNIMQASIGEDAVYITSGPDCAILYNDSWGGRGRPFAGTLPPGLWEITTVNANGDSCDVYYNIYLDPLFVDPSPQNFQLSWRSPCIDAGDPNFPLDPDNTVSDIGAFYFHHGAGMVELYPHVTVIPPEGGQLVYDGWVYNFTGHPGRADIWTYAFVPGVGRYGPIDLYRHLRIPPDSIGMNDIRQNVPGLAPAGDYVFVGYVGSYPSTIIDSSYFYFSKEGSVAGEIGDWSSSGLLMKAGDETTFGLPSHYVVSQNYPNPFNAKTVISYQLPADSRVKLEVYNTLGQKVAVLVDSKQQSGYRSVTWDASEVSSGIYFYKLTAGDYTETKRMMLVK